MGILCVCVCVCVSMCEGMCGACVCVCGVRLYVCALYAWCVYGIMYGYGVGGYMFVYLYT